MLMVVVLAWEVLGIDTGPHQYHLTVSAAGSGLPSAERRSPPACGPSSGSATKPPASVRRTGGVGLPHATRDPNVSASGSAFAAAIGTWGSHQGGPALLLPSSPPAGVAFWVAVPLAAVLIDVVARRSHGRSANAEEFARFISTSQLANVALVATWVFAGYHLFAR